ncbi:MAG: peptidoglycan D,D-transpeptidase FtsI family protein [Flexilinea sp.]
MINSIDSRFKSLVIGLSIFMGIVLIRILFLQTNAAAIELKESIGQAFEYTTLTVNSERGNIYDREGYLLAGNMVSYTVSLNLQASNTHGEFIANYLAPILEMDHDEIMKAAEVKYVENTAVEMPLTNFATKEQIEKIDQVKEFLDQRQTSSFESKTKTLENLDSVLYYPNIHRTYPDNELASNIIGFFPYLNPSVGASYGIEQYYDDILSGETIQQRFSLDPNVSENIPNLPQGASIVLTIDRKIQSIVEDSIKEAVVNNKAKSGTILISNPKTGEILAMATYPRININEYWKSLTSFTKDNRFNPAVMQPYEVGSVFKVITLAAAIDAGVIKPETVFNDTGTYDVMGVSIYNWDRGAWGPQTMIGCMQHSLNTCLSWMSEQLGAERFYKYLNNFGLNQPTGIELALEDYYPISEPGDDLWTPISLPTNSFGQGIMTTAIQMVTAVGALANEGKMMKPYIVKGIYFDDHTEITKPEMIGQPVSAETAKTVTEMLATSLEVEASDAILEYTRIAGKTGTGEIAKEGVGYVLSVTNASFVGWGPTEDPQFVTYVWLQEPLVNIWGSEVSAPLFSEVMAEVYPYLHLPTDRQLACLYTEECPSEDSEEYYYW